MDIVIDRIYKDLGYRFRWGICFWFFDRFWRCVLKKTEHDHIHEMCEQTTVIAGKAAEY